MSIQLNDFGHIINSDCGLNTRRITCKSYEKSSKINLLIMEDLPTDLFPRITILSFVTLLCSYVFQYIEFKVIQDVQIIFIITQIKIMKYMASEVISSASDGSLANKGNIDWNDFNYPICCKIYHFNADETPEIHRRRVFLIRLNHWLIILATLLNLITNIINTTSGVADGGIRIGISAFLFMFWTPISFLLFFYPYHIIMKDQGRPAISYGLSILAILFFFIWSIADFADANGFVMVHNNFAANNGAAGVFGLITAILMLLIGVLNGVNIIMFCRR